MKNERELSVCKRCNWKWFARYGSGSIFCPKCHSYYWNLDEVLKRKRAEENRNRKCQNCPDSIGD